MIILKVFWNGLYFLGQWFESLRDERRISRRNKKMKE